MGSAVAGLCVVPTTVAMGVSVVGSSVEVAGPPADKILISAHFTKVSCFFAKPFPQTPSSLQPQLLPAIHHHCITQ